MSLMPSLASAPSRQNVAVALCVPPMSEEKWGSAGTAWVAADHVAVKLTVYLAGGGSCG
jgi:hypothetical protein